MGTAERREREKEQRRNDIIDAAEKIFFSKGMETATMDEIADEAELSKGTLYLYFKSKEELFHAICQRGGAILLELFNKYTQKGSSGLDKIHLIGEAYYEFSQKYPDYFSVIKRADALQHCDCENSEEALKAKLQGEQTLGLVGKVVAEGISDGSIRSTLDPSTTATLLYGMSKGIFQIMSEVIPGENTPLVSDKQNFMNSFFEFIGYGLRPQ